jgi:hypothetical protein
MIRILDYIAKYDETLTIAQLKNAIKEEENRKKQKETEEVNTVKDDFSNTYLKIVDECTLFGATLNVYCLKDYVRSERTSDWDLIYYFEGSKISFSSGKINKRDFNPKDCNNSFNEKELRQMTIITKEEYDKYNWHYNEISKKLTDLIR